MAVRADGAATATALVRRRDARRRRTRGACLHDGPMRAFLSDHPTLRGFLIIGAIAAVVVALSLQPTLVALFLLVRIAFFLAIAFFVFLVWRERRSDIALWPRRASVAFYGAAILAIATLG